MFPFFFKNLNIKLKFYSMIGLFRKKTKKIMRTAIWGFNHTNKILNMLLKLRNKWQNLSIIIKVLLIVSKEVTMEILKTPIPLLWEDKKPMNK
jgi:hypothetical protein